MKLPYSPACLVLALGLAAVALADFTGHGRLYPGAVCFDDRDCLTNSCVFSFSFPDTSNKRCACSQCGASGGEVCSLGCQGPSRCIDAVCKTRRPAGAICRVDSDCLSGSCNQATALCQGRLLPGAACSNVSAPCVPGSTCERGADSRAAVCGCQSCIRSESCPAGCNLPTSCLFNSTSGRHVCSKGARPLGAACAFGGQCASAVCAAGKCSPKLLPGERCTDDRACKSGVCNCVKASQCDVNGGVVAPFVGKCACQRCKRGPSCPGGCDPPLTCQTDSLGLVQRSACVLVRENGASCSQSRSCASGNCEEGVCRPKRGPGARCSLASDCASGLCEDAGGDLGRVCSCVTTCKLSQTCRGGCEASEGCVVRGNATVCVAQGPLGALCSSDEACRSQHCVSGKCVAPRSAGDACTADSGCRSFNCVASARCGCDSQCAYNATTCPAGCTPPSQCLQNDGLSICGPPRGQGQECFDGFCSPGLYCFGGTCFLAPPKPPPLFYPKGFCCESADKCENQGCRYVGPAPDCDYKCVGTAPWGAYCNSNTDCKSGRCNKAACSCDLGQPGSCPTPLVCVERFDGGIAFNTCVQLAAVNYTCASSAECESGWCNDGRCAALLPTGRPCTGRRGSAQNVCASGSCTRSVCDCFSGACSRGVCNSGSQCVAAARECPQGCAPEQTCTAAVRFPGLPPREVCVASLPLGSACSASCACATGSCLNGACTDKLGLGVPCDVFAPQTCLSGRCVLGRCHV